MTAGADSQRPTFGPLDFGIGQLFDVIPDAVIVGDAIDGRVLLWNEGAAEMFGYPPEQAVGMLIEELIPEALRDRHRLGLERFRRGEPSPLVETHAAVELPGLHRDGSLLTVELRLSRLRRQPAGAAYVLAVLRDVTERRRLQESIEAGAVESAERAVWLRTFFSMAAHDIQNPLMVVTGVLDELQHSSSAAPEMRAMVEMATRQAEHLRRLVDDIMTVARLETGSMLASPEPIELRLAVLEATAGHLEAVEIDVAPDLDVVADRTHVNRIVHNLVANALKHGEPPVVLGATADAGGVRLEVSDGGGGVPADIVDRLFEPFTRSESVRAPGSGLGLAAVRKLAELNGGRAWYDAGAEAAGRSTFCVWLPSGSAAPGH